MTNPFFSSARYYLRVVQTIPVNCIVIASEAKQSRVPAWTGLLRRQAGAACVNLAAMRLAMTVGG
jgi:hypothetical protein